MNTTVKLSLVATLALSLGAGCGDRDGAADTTGIGTVTVTADGTDDNTGTATGPMKFDISGDDGTGGSAEGSEGDGCEKVDFVGQKATLGAHGKGHRDVVGELEGCDRSLRPRVGHQAPGPCEEVRRPVLHERPE